MGREDKQKRPYRQYEATFDTDGLINSTHLPTRNSNRSAQQNDPAVINSLSTKMMEQTFGQLLLNYVKGINKSIPQTDTVLKEKLSFLNNNKEVALVSLAGYDTWDTPIEKMDQEQVNAALRALSWITTEMVHKLSTNQQQGMTNGVGTILGTNQADYQAFQTAVNSISLFRGSLILRDQQLNPSYYTSNDEYSGGSSSSSSAGRKHYVSDVYLYWDPLWGYGYHPCYYDYHHAVWHHRNERYNWGNLNGVPDFGYCHGNPFPVVNAIGEHIIAPVVKNTAEMYSNLFQLQVDIAEGAVKLAGQAFDASKDIAVEGFQTVTRSADGCCEPALNCISDGACDVLHCFGHVGHDLCHCASNIGGGVCDIFSQCGNICCEVAGACGKCGGGVDCKCDCDGEVCKVCGVIGGGVYACCSFIFGGCDNGNDNPAPETPPATDPPSSADMYSQGMTDSVTGHEHYTIFTTGGTIAYAALCGLPMLYHAGQDTCTLMGNSASPRDRLAASWDLAATVACIGIAEGVAFLIAPQAMGPRVITNMAISGGRCGQIGSEVVRKHSETKAYAGVTHPDKYFLKAGEINQLIKNTQIQARQTGRESEVSKLDTVARANTQLFNTAKEEKHVQWKVVRKVSNFVSCGGYGYQVNNAHEVNRNNAIADIGVMRSGAMPNSVTQQPPSYDTQPYTMV